MVTDQGKFDRSVSVRRFCHLKTKQANKLLAICEFGSRINAREKNIYTAYRPGSFQNSLRRHKYARANYRSNYDANSIEKCYPSLQFYGVFCLDLHQWSVTIGFPLFDFVFTHFVSVCEDRLDTGLCASVYNTALIDTPRGLRLHTGHAHWVWLISL